MTRFHNWEFGTHTASLFGSFASSGFGTTGCLPVVVLLHGGYPKWLPYENTRWEFFPIDLSITERLALGNSCKPVEYDGKLIVGAGNSAYACDGRDWYAFGKSTFNGLVLAVYVDENNDLWAGGAFTSYGGDSNVARIAKWDPESFDWVAVSSGIANAGSVYCFAEYGSVLHIGGSGLKVAAPDTAAVVMTTDGSSFSSVVLSVSGSEGVLSMKSYTSILGSFLVLGGGFSSLKYGTTVVSGMYAVAYWDGSVVGQFGGVDRTVKRVYLSDDNTLYIGGDFSLSWSAGPVWTTCRGIAYWDGSTWVEKSGGIGLGAITDIVYDIAEYDGGLYAAGRFAKANAGADDVYNVVRENGGSWQAWDFGDLPASVPPFFLNYAYSFTPMRWVQDQ